MNKIYLAIPVILILLTVGIVDAQGGGWKVAFDDLLQRITANDAEIEATKVRVTDLETAVPITGTGIFTVSNTETFPAGQLNTMNVGVNCPANSVYVKAAIRDSVPSLQQIKDDNPSESIFLNTFEPLGPLGGGDTFDTVGNSFTYFTAGTNFDLLIDTTMTVTVVCLQLP